MKKISFFAILGSVFLILTSCASTEAVAPSPSIPQSAEEAVSKTHEDVAEQIANELNSVSPAQSEQKEIPAEVHTEEAQPEETHTETLEAPALQTEIPEVTAPSEEEEDFSEKVSEEDSNLAKERENAPTTDERGRVSEYPIFEEPEVIVLDLPEEEAQPATTTESESPASEVTDTVPPPAPEAENQEQVAKEDEVQKTETPKPAPQLAEVQTQAVPSPSESKVEEANEPQEEQKNEAIPAEESETITPSRSVTIKINQYLDITYPGKGWTYIGETEKDGLFNYFGRKLGSNNTTFSLRAKKAGSTFLHFYKNDALTGEYIDDYLSVTVENKRSSGRVKAPSYADIVPAKPQRRIERAQENAQESTQEQIQSTDSKPLPLLQNQESTPKKEQDNAKGTNSQTNEKQDEQKAPSRAVQPSQNQVQNTAQTAPTESGVKTVIQNTDPALTNVTVTDPTPQVSSQNQDEAPEQTKSIEYTPVSSQSTQAEEDSIQSEGEVQSTQAEPWKANRTTSAHSSDESLLEKAKKDFVDGKFEDALKEAQEYYNTANTRLDEALFLLGQISESNSSVKDIRFAVDSYDMLVKRFPASKLWKQAKNRSIYLKRFYIDIR